MPERNLFIRPRSRPQPHGEDDMAQQQFAADCDINNILAQYRRTGVIKHMAPHVARYGDIPALTFQEAQNIVLEARNMFQSLSGELRQRFGNDPAQFLAFVQDDNNRDEAVKLGLIPKPTLDPAPAAEEKPTG